VYGATCTLELFASGLLAEWAPSAQLEQVFSFSGMAFQVVPLLVLLLFPALRALRR